MYFYNWGGTRLPIVLQAEGGAPTQVALAVEELQRWLTKASITSCGAVIRWTRAGTAETPVQGTTVRRLDGTTTHLGAGDSVRITESPVPIR